MVKTTVAKPALFQKIKPHCVFCKKVPLGLDAKEGVPLK